MNKFRDNLGSLTIIAMSLVPALLWISIKPISARIANLTTILTSLGQISGLVGMAMFATTLMLSKKSKFLENYFGGPHKVYSAHHIFGGIAFILLLSHPLFLASKYLLTSSKDASLFLLPSDDWAINFGIFSLLLLISLLFLAFFVKLPHEKWKLAHQFLGLSFFFAGFHIFLVTSDISRSPPLQLYMSMLTSIGLLAYLHQTIFGSIMRYYKNNINNI